MADKSESKPTFAGYPVTKYHPVHGAMSASDPNEAAQMFQPEHDWFNTAAEADMHRTDREAGEVVHRNMRQKLNDHEEAERPVVRNSVAAQESIDNGGFEPL